MRDPIGNCGGPGEPGCPPVPAAIVTVLAAQGVTVSEADATIIRNLIHKYSAANYARGLADGRGVTDEIGRDRILQQTLRPSALSPLDSAE